MKIDIPGFGRVILSEEDIKLILGMIVFFVVFFLRLLNPPHTVIEFIGVIAPLFAIWVVLFGGVVRSSLLREFTLDDTIDDPEKTERDLWK